MLDARWVPGRDRLLARAAFDQERGPTTRLFIDARVQLQTSCVQITEPRAELEAVLYDIDAALWREHPVLGLKIDVKRAPGRRHTRRGLTTEQGIHLRIEH